MMFEIIFYHFFSYISCTPDAIAYCPEVSAPVLLAQRRKFLLKKPRTSTLHPFDKIAYAQRRSVFYQHMYVILTNRTFEDSYILSITHLLDDIPTSYLDITCQYFLAIFCHKYYVCAKSGNRMAAMSIVCTHLSNIRKNE